MSSAENGLSTAGWSLWGGAADSMQFFICLFACLFFWGRGFMSMVLQRVGWRNGADIGVWGPGIDFECSWDGLCWILLVS